jgi:hypothetical protein
MSLEFYNTKTGIRMWLVDISILHYFMAKPWYSDN